MPSARRACCSASSDCPSRRFFRHSLKSFIPASEGDVVPIQWDIGSFLNPAGTSRVTERRVPLRSARANRTSVQFLGYSLLLSLRTGKYFCKAGRYIQASARARMRPEAPDLLEFTQVSKQVRPAPDLPQIALLGFSHEI